MIRLSYSTFGLTQLDFADAVDAVDRAGYEGIEISFHRDQFNPFELDDDDLTRLKKQLAGLRVKPACVATASHFFTPSQPHEPSLLAPERAARKRRIDLIRRGIHVARKLGVPLVTFGSGFIRDTHLAHPQIDAGKLLLDSIHECLQFIGDDEDITLLIEPEPGMFIETIAEGLALMRAVDSPRFKLHTDLCHAYCSEPDYISALAEVAGHTRYLHISDASAGYNLKIAHDADDLPIDLDFASMLVHFQNTSDFLLLDRAHPIHFRDGSASRTRQARVEALLAQADIDRDLAVVDYATLPTASSPLDDEIFTYLISMPGLSYDVLARARPVIAWLRGAANPPLVNKMVANTLTGIVHFHDIPGRGSLDFAASFKALTDNGFSGYGSVELYHHVDSWQSALHESLRHLSQFTRAA